jgi:hypothetical protein
MSIDLEILFREFLRECRYLRNLSLATILSYEPRFGMLLPFVNKRDGDGQQALMDFAAIGRRNPGGIKIMKLFAKWILENKHVDAAISLKKQKSPNGADPCAHAARSAQTHPVLAQG